MEKASYFSTKTKSEGNFCAALRASRSARRQLPQGHGGLETKTKTLMGPGRALSTDVSMAGMQPAPSKSRESSSKARTFMENPLRRLIEIKHELLPVDIYIGAIHAFSIY